MAIETKTFQTNWSGLRLVKLEDLQPGAEMLAVDTDRWHDPGTNPELYASRIVLDPDPVRNNVVYFHTTLPEWEGQCFVPVSQFVDPDAQFVHLVKAA